MVLHTRTVTVEQFFAFITEPENAGRRFELIAGEIVQTVGSGYASRVAARIVRYVDEFVDEHDLGTVTTADGGYMIAGHPYIPDVAYMSSARQSRPEYREGYNVLAPDLAVEVLSSGNTESQITTKVVNYLRAGSIVWLVDPELQKISIYAPGSDPYTLTESDTLTGGEALPGFSVPVEKLFPPR
jgi:Uma2 family endonuclease